MLYDLLDIKETPPVSSIQEDFKLMWQSVITEKGDHDNAFRHICREVNMTYVLITV